GAVTALTRAMAIDHIAQGVRVNAVAPGTVNSPYFDRMLAAADNPTALRASLDGRSPLGRMAEPAEIADAIVWLAFQRIHLRRRERADRRWRHIYLGTLTPRQPRTQRPPRVGPSSRQPTQPN